MVYKSIYEYTHYNAIVKNIFHYMNFDELKKSFNGGNALYVHGEPGWVTCDNQNRPVPKLSLFPIVFRRLKILPSSLVRNHGRSIDYLPVVIDRQGMAPVAPAWRWDALPSTEHRAS